MFGKWQETIDEAFSLIRELIDSLREHTEELRKHRTRA